MRRSVFELTHLLKQRQRSFDEHRVMSMEVFRRRKFGGEPGDVPDDGYGDVFLVIDNYAGHLPRIQGVIGRACFIKSLLRRQQHVESPCKLS